LVTNYGVYLESQTTGNTTNWGIYSAGGSNYFGGNILVGTTTPSANLTVNGTSNLGPIGNITITGGSNGQVLTTNGSGTLSWGNVVTTSVVVASANTTVSVSDTVIVGANSIYITLPPSASAGNKVTFVPRPSINSYTINPNGGKIMADTANLTVDVQRPFVLMYDNAANGWLLGSL
jgi:hypothetical protein